jgi:hypothetical protein
MHARLVAVTAAVFGDHRTDREESRECMSKRVAPVRRIDKGIQRRENRMPKYAALIYSPAETEGTGTPEDWAQIMAEYNEFGEKAGAAGVLAGGEALQDTATATTVRARGKGGDVVTSDGPFAETKDVLGGFYILDCADLDEAVSWAAQIPGAWHGMIEVRPLIDFSE